jgi:hypothetical protein
MSSKVGNSSGFEVYMILLIVKVKEMCANRAVVKLREAVDVTASSSS